MVSTSGLSTTYCGISSQSGPYFVGASALWHDLHEIGSQAGIALSHWKASGWLRQSVMTGLEDDVIVFNLGCENSHRFEGWFASSEDFERQLGGKLVICPLCGNANVSRLPHAVHINKTVSKERRPTRAESAAFTLQQYANVGSEVLVKLVEHIVENTEDVGTAFPEEARKIHYQEAPERRIRGTASRDEVEALKDEGIEVVALPIPAHRLGKTH